MTNNNSKTVFETVAGALVTFFSRGRYSLVRIPAILFPYMLLRNRRR